MSDWQKRKKEKRTGRLPAVKSERPTYPARELGYRREPTDEDVPEGLTLSDASVSEMSEAGFPREGGPDLVDVETGKTIPADKMRFFVLRDEHGRIVATWDEGRWFSAYESARYTREWAERIQTARRRGPA